VGKTDIGVKNMLLNNVIVQKNLKEYAGLQDKYMEDKTEYLKQTIRTGTVDEIENVLLPNFHKIKHTESFCEILQRMKGMESKQIIESKEPCDYCTDRKHPNCSKGRNGYFPLCFNGKRLVEK
jgi:hypothetical protein